MRYGVVAYQPQITRTSVVHAAVPATTYNISVDDKNNLPEHIKSGNVNTSKIVSNDQIWVINNIKYQRPRRVVIKNGRNS